MAVWTRPAEDGDRERFVWVESGAIKGISYVDDVWDLFTKNNDGEFTAAFYDNELGGIGKLTRLYDGYGWLEALRVHPDFQRKGLGNAIYKRYMEQMDEMGLNAVGMYTGYKNVASRALAEKNGLSLAGRFSEYTAVVSATDPGEKLPTESELYEIFGVHPVSEEDGEAVLSPYYEQIGSFAVVNRSFYPVKAGLGKQFAHNKWLHKCGNHGIIIIGARFQPEKALHIPFITGDTVNLIKFAEGLARLRQARTLSAIRPYDDSHEKDMLLSNGFIKEEMDIITLWKGLCSK